MGRHTQRKNNIVTRHTGNRASRTVSSEAFVTWSSRVRRECTLNILCFFLRGSTLGTLISAMVKGM